MLILIVLMTLTIKSISISSIIDDLVISKYIENSSNYNLLEFYNPINNTLNLREGGVADKKASAMLLTNASLISNSDLFSGDDNLVLRHKEKFIDSVDQKGEAPSIQRKTSFLSIKNNILPRTLKPLHFDTTINDRTSLESWKEYKVNDFSNPIKLKDPGKTDPKLTPLICNNPATAIHLIQGNGEKSPLIGQTVVVEAIVTSNYEAGLRGFFLQMAENEIDGDKLTSEGIFAYTGTNPLAYTSGDRVRLQATVTEFNNLTQLSNITQHKLCTKSHPIPTATKLILPLKETRVLEALEGMRVFFDQRLIVNEVYNLGRYGEVLLGSQRHYIGTQVAAPGADALAVTKANILDSILLDDGLMTQNPEPIRYPEPELSANNTLRVGDSLIELNAIMHYKFEKYQLAPVNFVNFRSENIRQSISGAPQNSNITVANFNLLNYFNGDGQDNGFPTERGADSKAEFSRQSSKIINAIRSIDADILGLMELENDGYNYDSAITDLIRRLNATTDNGQQYAFIRPTEAKIGTDAITVGIIYRVDKVIPVGQAKILSSANSPLDDSGNVLFNDKKNRPMLIQAFKPIAKKKKFIIAVSHLKSKGSDCDSLNDPDTGDGQGNCNRTRTRAATAIARWLEEEYPKEDILLIGDLNSYAKEDPLSALAQAGYNELFAYFGLTNNYSYIFSGESGQLDYALANDSLLKKVTGVFVWHINADEPSVLDYNEEFKSVKQLQTLYSRDAYRSSDHDPIITYLLFTDKYSGP
ncbi:MAG: ExeM/NucH family extracellular endonuclease [Gammaproteobacteria bacterium]|nr:ExeM/NucH family extracellular endonuclease [Gammaproteobacteria bacterium]